MLSHTPLAPDLYGGLAVAHLQAGMAQRAAAQSARAIQAGVEPAAARKAVARACAEVNAFARVASELEACLSYDNEDLEAWAGLAEATRWLGRFEREAECLTRLQEADPDNVELRLQMARNQRDQGCAETVLELLEQLLTDDEPPLAALLLAAEVLAEQGDPGLQEALARRALSQGENTGWASYWLADSLSRDGSQAAAAYQEAITSLKRQLAHGVTPRRAARIWQAIYVAASWLQDEPTAREACKKARQEAAICEAIGSKVESVIHHRAVSTEQFLQALPQLAADSSPPHAGGADLTAADTAAPPSSVRRTGSLG
jgi:tetratricopeptide (TPR) repeat protein